MKRVKKIKRLFWLSVAFIVLASSAFLFMPLTVEANQNKRILMIAIGSSFWTLSAASYIFLILADKQRKWLINNRGNGNVRMDCLPGLISFFTNIPGTVFDVVMFTSLITLIIIAFTKWRYDYISYILLFLFYLSLNLHSMFNGRIYKSTKFKRIRRDCTNE